MAISDVSAAGWTRVDLIAKYIFQLSALVGFLLLAQTVWQREAASQASCS
jgi:hypothetical protein